MLQSARKTGNAAGNQSETNLASKTLGFKTFSAIPTQAITQNTTKTSRACNWIWDTETNLSSTQDTSTWVAFPNQTQKDSLGKFNPLYSICWQPLASHIAFHIHRSLQSKIANADKVSLSILALIRMKKSVFHQKKYRKQSAPILLFLLLNKWFSTLIYKSIYGYLSVWPTLPPLATSILSVSCPSANFITYYNILFFVKQYRLYRSLTLSGELIYQAAQFPIKEYLSTKPLPCPSIQNFYQFHNFNSSTLGSQF